MPLEPISASAIRELIESDAVTAATRRVLNERLEFDQNYQPRFFDPNEYEILKAVCDALAPSPVVPCDFVAAEIDKRLFENTGNGWRYAEMPVDGETYRIALSELNKAARAEHRDDFARLTNRQRKEIFRLLRNGELQFELPISRFLEELCAEFVELFYSHPLCLAEIDYRGFADAHGWQKIGLNERDERIPISDSKFQVQSREIVKTSDENVEAQEKSAMRAFADREIVDAVIIGTGAGGAPILARLAAANLKVVGLEAGKDFDYKQFPTDERAQSQLFWTDERLSAGNNPVAFGNNNSGCGVGGSTVHFTAYVPRAQADDFRLFTEFGVGRDWVLPFAEIEKYYDELEWFLGVSGNSNYPWGTRGKNYPLPPLQLNAAAELMQRACRALDIETSPAPNAALSADYFNEQLGKRPACTNRGYCQAGCSVGAKGSMDATFIPFAIKNGAEIRSECFVTGFEFDQHKQISAVVYVQNNETKKQLCKNVFLCAGGIESARILLINDLANSSGQVGRNFMAHPGVQVWGVFDEETNPHKGIPGGLISEDTHRPQKRFGANFAGGYLLQSIGAMPVTYASQLARGERIWGEQLNGWMQDYNHTAGINILGDCLPHAANFIELADEKDVRGLPKPRVHFSHGENEIRMTAHATKLMREIWTAAGARKTWTFQRNAHVIGTCAMGDNAADSVVNQDCRSFDIGNLYICDNSVFPSALSVNPSLTIMALALRTADEFLRGAKRLDSIY